MKTGSAALSATYRAGGTSHAIDLAAYLVARLPATYAAVSHVLSELRARRPGFCPASLLDAGSGPGTASWAAAEAWPELARVTFLDSAPEFLKLAQRLAAGGPDPVASAQAVPGSIEVLPGGLSADLVTPPMPWPNCRWRAFQTLQQGCGAQAALHSSSWSPARQTASHESARRVMCC